MSYSTERAYIARYLQDSDFYESLTPVVFENLDLPDVENTEYCYFSIKNLGGFQVTRGGSSNLHRYYGETKITIYTNIDKGVSSSLLKADMICSRFLNSIITISDKETVVFQEPTVFRGKTKDGRYAVEVTCPFYRNEYK